MKCLMPLNQRQVIADAIAGKRYVEWGMGGSTVWLANNATPADALTIEHDADWFYKVERRMPRVSAFTMLRVHCTPGLNATIGEEHATDADAYIAAGVDTVADVYLIDGVVRGRCLLGLVDTRRPMTVFLHDTQRDWYDAAIAKAIAAGFERTDYPEGEDYPGCLLTQLCYAPARR